MVRRGAVICCAILLTTRALAQDPVEPIVVNPGAMVVLPPPLKRPINWEPFILTGAGAILLGVGIWRLLVAEANYQALKAIPAVVPAMSSSEEVLQRARQLAADGKLNTGLGWVLLGLGAAAVGGSVLWVSTEGLLKDPVVSLMPGPGGLVAAGRF